MLLFVNREVEDTPLSVWLSDYVEVKSIVGDDKYKVRYYLDKLAPEDKVVIEHNPKTTLPAFEYKRTTISPTVILRTQGTHRRDVSALFHYIDRLWKIEDTEIPSVGTTMWGWNRAIRTLTTPPPIGYSEKNIGDGRTVVVIATPNQMNTDLLLALHYMRDRGIVPDIYVANVLYRGVRDVAKSVFNSHSIVKEIQPGHNWWDTLPRYTFMVISGGEYIHMRGIAASCGVLTIVPHMITGYENITPHRARESSYEEFRKHSVGVIGMALLDFIYGKSKKLTNVKDL